MKTNILEKSGKNIPRQILQLRIPVYLIFLVIIYGFIILRVNTLSKAEANQSAAVAQTNSAVPQIDQATVNKIKQLQDNSVSVQALFDQARQNPFKE